MPETQNRYGSLYAPLPKNAVRAGDGHVYEHRVPTRDERRALVELDVTPSNGISVGGQHVKAGTHRVVVYESELQALKESVATAEHKRAWDEAEATFAAQRERWITNAIGKPDGTQGYAIKREHHLKMYGETTPSLEFSRKYPGGMPPIARLDVVESLPAPETEGNRDAKRLEGLITQLVEGLGRAVGGGGRKAAG